MVAQSKSTASSSKATVASCKLGDTIRVSVQSKFAGLLRAEVQHNRGYIQVGGVCVCKWCPFRYFRRPADVDEHQDKYHTTAKGYSCMGPQQMAVASALHDNDVITHGVCRGNYLQRSATLLRSQIKTWPPNHNTVKKGIIKRVAFADGIRFMHKDEIANGYPMRRISLQLFASRSFYNFVFQEMILNKGSLNFSRDNVLTNMRRHGCEVVAMLPVRVDDWWAALMEDIMSSDVVQKMQQSFINSLTATKEMEHPQFDATAKVMMQIKSQGNYRTSKILKMSQALPDEQALYRIGCLKGTTGAVRVVMPIHDEGSDTIYRLLQAELSDEEIATIKTFSVDNATPKLEVALGQLCLNFQGLIQDNSHLLIRYRQAFWGKKSPGAALLQQILSKFNRFSDTNGIGGRTGGIIRYFKSSDTLRVSASEKKHFDLILDAKMPIESALSYVQSMDFDRPFVNRLTFVKMIAALTSLYPKETTRTVPPGPLTIRQVLQNGCQPESVEYKLNHTRLLHSVDAKLRGFIASGTTSIEALHSELNNHWFHNTPTVFQSTVLLKTQMFRFAKLWAHHKMMFATTNRSYKQQIVTRWMVAATELWSDAEWAIHCGKPLDLPLMKMKNMHRLLHRSHKAKSPGRDPSTIVLQRGGNRKRIVLKKGRRMQKLTPFNIPRRNAVIRSTKGGVRWQGKTARK